MRLMAHEGVVLGEERTVFRVVGRVVDGIYI